MVTIDILVESMQFIDANKMESLYSKVFMEDRVILCQCRFDSIQNFLGLFNGVIWNSVNNLSADAIVDLSDDLLHQLLLVVGWYKGRKTMVFSSLYSMPTDIRAISTIQCRTRYIYSTDLCFSGATITFSAILVAAGATGCAMFVSENISSGEVSKITVMHSSRATGVRPVWGGGMVIRWCT